jgi:Histidine kinase-, DNA gyrase B-, and HSP90-like ATPase
MPAEPDRFHGEIKVASRIVDYLSSGLYESPAACLKELVNNSYDADARVVHVFVKPDADRIIIEDDGLGMTKDEFVAHFSRISESHKREGTDRTPSGRPKIGKIGIGFIAANEICDVMEIFSTRAGESALLHVKINFARMRINPAQRKREGDAVAKADYEGIVTETDKPSHYTKIFLKQIRGEAKSILASAKRATSGEEELPSLYGLTPQSMANILAQPWLRSWSDLDPYSENMLRVGLNVPIKYHTHWLPSVLQRRVKDLERRVANLNFSVNYDGSDLRKPIVLRAKGKKAVLERFRFKGKRVSAEGYFFAQHGALRPQELNGLLIRVRNAAVGGYDGSFLEFPISEGTLFQRWISSEVWADDRLEDAMNIDRRTLRIAHPAYAELQQQVHSALSKFLRRLRVELWEKASASRKIAAARADLKALSRLLKNVLPSASDAEINELIAVWMDADERPTIRRQLFKKRSVLDVYRVATEVGVKLLPPRQLRKYIELLTQRLTRE